MLKTVQKSPLFGFCRLATRTDTKRLLWGFIYSLKYALQPTLVKFKVFSFEFQRLFYNFAAFSKFGGQTY